MALVTSSVISYRPVKGEFSWGDNIVIVFHAEDVLGHPEVGAEGGYPARADNPHSHLPGIIQGPYVVLDGVRIGIQHHESYILCDYVNLTEGLFLVNGKDNHLFPLQDEIS